MYEEILKKIEIFEQLLNYLYLDSMEIYIIKIL